MKRELGREPFYPRYPLLGQRSGVLASKTKGTTQRPSPLCSRVLEARERVVGREHPDTLTSVNNLALVLLTRGDYAAAEPLYRRALEARERVVGREHPDTLQSVNNLAGLLDSKGDYAAAESLYRRAVEAFERVLGSEHPNTLASINNLAGLLLTRGGLRSGRAPLPPRAGCQRARPGLRTSRHANLGQ